jgi:hypothetical protein
MNMYKLKFGGYSILIYQYYKQYFQSSYTYFKFGNGPKTLLQNVLFSSTHNYLIKQRQITG